jgi:cell division protein FtsI (penicillin-binding protein 3)
VIDCGGGGIDIGGTRISDHHAYDQLTFRGVIAKSSNVGAIRVAQRVGREGFNRYLREFGFGAPTGVDLPGESAGLLRPTSRWSALSLPSISFGQEIGVTALQMASAVGAVANGGYLMKPMIVRQVEDSEGRVVHVTRPVAVRQVLEPPTVDTLTDLLRGVVREGTGKRADVPGYVVAGKTGTAQKIDAAGRYSMVDHVASFVGFVPASQPALVVLVSLDTPRGERNEAGDVAAPLFSRIAEQALRHLAVPPDDTERTMRLATYHPPVAEPAVWRADSSTAAVAPAAAVMPAGPPAGRALMPDLHGRPAREAAIEAARRGLIVELRGSGRVFAQRPEPGTELEPGTTCVLTLRRPAPEDHAPAEGR